jgi:hypothetical protein
MLRAVTWPPLCVVVAFHAWVICCPAVYDQVNVQLVIGSPRLVMFRFAVNPPGHCDGTEYATEQPAVAAFADRARAVPARTVPAAATVATTSRALDRVKAGIPGVPSTHGGR